jgi:hypothetical protein
MSVYIFQLDTNEEREREKELLLWIINKTNKRLGSVDIN